VSLYLSGGTKAAYAVGGMLAVVAGMLLAGPLAIRLVGGVRGVLPLAGRLAVVDLARFRARSGAAVAAITLALAIPAGIVIATSAAEYTDRQENGLGNLAASDLVVRIGERGPLVTVHTPEQLAPLESRAAAIAALLPQATATGLDMAVTPSIRERTESGQQGSPAVELGVPVPGEAYLASYPLFVATPELLAVAGISPESVGSETDLLSHHQGRMELTNIARRDFVPVSQRVPHPGYGSVPSEFVTPGAMSRNGWQAARVGWLVQSDRPLTPAQVAAAQDIAASAGLTIETRREPESTATVRLGALGAGALIALAVLASTVGLIRGEARQDVRTLAALGMPRRRRRAITAATAATLAATGALLGTVSAYLVLIGLYRHNLAALSTVPAGHLTAIALGIPVLAAAGAWFAAGSRPGQRP
jgi:putative ABC transport system permease protein